ncbi:hypothetical protein M422DRAFT_270578 [Sphaerobolus stellatus SS14]|uniref:Coiled-coil domain-containing protein 137 n=1 Tax=Sphaerobolus stellatus (strain SS14) TaxID=990650 RepID=A0A0C9U232_SPHS4|nr:hypothetical protein M422DRAFT_270578 [Sphaerobolus stellatus SS14]
MPHKRGKLSARRGERAKIGSDLAPPGAISVASEAIPKNVMRVLQAEEIRKVHNEKRKRQLEEGVPDGEDREPKKRKKEQKGEQKKKPQIKHGESLGAFNRRVEEEMRVELSEAFQTSRTETRKARKTAAKEKAERIAKAQKPKAAPEPSSPPPPKPEPPKQPKHTQQANKMVEFGKATVGKRFNDIVQAPPTFTKLPRGAKKIEAQGGGKSKKADVVSMAQKQMMDIEREKAIKHYRELKESRLAAGKAV